MQHPVENATKRWCCVTIFSLRIRGSKAEEAAAEASERRMKMTSAKSTQAANTYLFKLQGVLVCLLWVIDVPHQFARRLIYLPFVCSTFCTSYWLQWEWESMTRDVIESWILKKEAVFAFFVILSLSSPIYWRLPSFKFKKRGHQACTIHVCNITKTRSTTFLFFYYTH